MKYLATLLVLFSALVLVGCKRKPADVRPVDPPKSQVTQRFVVQANDQEVADNTQKLIWKRCVEGLTFVGNKCTGAQSTFSAADIRAKIGSPTPGGWIIPLCGHLQGLYKSEYSGPDMSLVITLDDVFPESSQASKEHFWCRLADTPTTNGLVSFPDIMVFGFYEFEGKRMPHSFRPGSEAVELRMVKAQ
ncbi:MAG: hypothetical protein H7293_10940 [Candidatus Saccharibacteria bacterium]|nr:hypothetical protein [Rhodoferax sp.]